MKYESQHPFMGELNSIESKESFDIHRLNTKPEKTILDEGVENDFTESEYAITEFHSTENKNHESFLKLKHLYESMQEELGDFIPKSFFVEGEPSNDEPGKSFYVVQKFDNQKFNTTAKELNDLNSKEFSIEFLDQLLLIQEKINNFVEVHAQELSTDWLDKGVLDSKKFKESILYSPENKEIKIANLFKLSPEATKQVIGNETKFEPSKDRLKVLKMLGLASLIEKIDWALEKSAAPEWIKGKGVHWNLDKNKLKQEGKNAMALTFDDGPNDETETLLDILKETNTKATFFVVDSLIKGREGTIKRIINEGHDIGVHEWGQEGAKPGAGPKEYSKRFFGPRTDLGDVKKTTELIEKVSGIRPTMGRVAGVHGTIDSLREFQSMDLEIIHGNPYDIIAIPPSPSLKSEDLLKKALSGNGQGRIRIFHIGAMKDGGDHLDRSEINFDKGEVYPPEETVKMIKEYIDMSSDQGYEFVKVKDYIS
ncbi:MAG: polysaccharide deacetylase family protein [Candidatus Doudnabacteria bacterium]